MIIFSGEESRDLIFLEIYIRQSYRRLGIKEVEIDPAAMNRAVDRMYYLPWQNGNGFTGQPSCFKKAGAFTTCFCFEQPILTPLPSLFGALSANQNAVIAFNICQDELEGSIIDCKTRGPLVATGRIQPSIHHWSDLISAFGRSDPDSHYEFGALVYEGLVYAANPHIPYPDRAPVLAGA